MSAQPLPIETFGMGIDDTKGTILYQNPFCFADKT